VFLSLTNSSKYGDLNTKTCPFAMSVAGITSLVFFTSESILFPNTLTQVATYGNKKKMLLQRTKAE
jgi:hypothetical protein